MEIFYISETQVSQSALGDLQTTTSSKDFATTGENEDARRFLWLDVTHEEVLRDPEAWRDEVENVTGIRIFDLHLKDVINLWHPSYFDATQDYELVVFQKLALNVWR